MFFFFFSEFAEIRIVCNAYSDSLTKCFNILHTNIQFLKNNNTDAPLDRCQKKNKQCKKEKQRQKRKKGSNHRYSRYFKIHKMV